MNEPAERTTCLVVGGGPADMMLGLLLARGGVDVTVMEKHADFRGDTVHASTLRLLDDLGLGQDFERVTHRAIESIGTQVQGVPVTSTCGGSPAGTSTSPWPLNGTVTGVQYRRPDGRIAEMHADLTVACDGRGSVLRAAMGLLPRTFGAPTDVWWFRLPRTDQDPPGLEGVLSSGAMITIDRGDYHQCAYIIPKRSDARLPAEGIASLQRAIVAMVPLLADRVGQLSSFDDVKLLDVQLNGLRRWYGDGLLLIADAAHAMSPVGGVGINHAAADAVAAARIPAGPLRRGRVSGRDLARIQVRRWVPTALIQGMQRVIHAKVIAAAVTDAGPARPPLAVRVVGRLPLLRTVAGYVAGYAVAIGPLPERAPRYARRRSPSAT